MVDSRPFPWMQRVFPGSSTKDTIISSVFGRGTVGEVVKHGVTKTEKFFKREGDARQKAPPPKPPDPEAERKREEYLRRVFQDTAGAQASLDDQTVLALGALVGATTATEIINDAGAMEAAKTRVGANLTLDSQAGPHGQLANQGTKPQERATHDEGASHSEQLALASDTDDAHTDDAVQRPETDDDEEDSQEQLARASDDEDAPTEDAAAQRPATDDDQDSSQEEVARAPDDEDAATDDAAQQPAADDEEDASEQEVAIASRPEDAPSDNVDVVKPASVEAVIVQALGDQAGPAASVPVIPDEGFSFSAFPKQATSADVVKEAMPAGQLSQEDIPGSGIPESESAHPDAGSEDVGNAAPSTDRVVHHGDLAP